MVEFNPDGSLKLPASVLKAKEDASEKMKSQRFIKITKELVNFTAPKKCTLHIVLSDAITDQRFIETIYAMFRQDAKTPTSLRRVNDKEFDIDIGSDFKRCTDCTRLIGQYREFLYGNVIEKKGNCTFEGRITNFHDEDYFD